MDCRALGLLTPSFPFSQNLLSMYVASGTILGSEDAAVTKTGPFPACQSWEWRPGLFLTHHKGVGSHFQMSWWLGKLFHPPTFSAACAAPTSPPSSPLNPFIYLGPVPAYHISWACIQAEWEMGHILSWHYFSSRHGLTGNYHFSPASLLPLSCLLGEGLWVGSPWRAQWLHWGCDFSGAGGCHL